MTRPSSFAPIVIPRLVGLLVAVTVCAAPRVARANGAFPESFQMILPVDRPQQIALATNFGLIISDDDGATWDWTCEQQETMNGSLYTVSAPPDDRFFSVSALVGMAYSDDVSCTWHSSTGTVERFVVTDFFPDPTNTKRALALGASPDPAEPSQVLPSDDGGKTFKDGIYTAPDGATLQGVEIARSAPDTIYVAMYLSVPAPGIHPKLARSRDGGKSWDLVDLEPTLGQNMFRIIAVDPDDDKVISLRVIEPDGDFLAISRDGGQSFTKAFKLDGGSLTAYTKVDAMTVLVGGAVLDQGRGFRSTDGGKTFQDWKSPTTLPDGTTLPNLHVRALAARGGKVYAAAKNYSDGVAVAVSTDGGLTFRGLMRYEDVKGIRACAQETCFEGCRYQATAQVWDVAICGKGSQMPEPPEPPPPTKSGCGCQVGDGHAPWAVAALLLLGVAGFAGRSRRRR
jgi:MYXO-CTERM domain-containing protein